MKSAVNQTKKNYYCANQIKKTKGYLKRVNLLAMLFIFFTISNFSYGQWVTTTDGDIYNSNTGFVGIGTSSPESLLHVDVNDPYNWAAIIENGDGYGQALLVKGVYPGADPTLPIFRIEDNLSTKLFEILGNGSIDINSSISDYAISFRNANTGGSGLLIEAGHISYPSHPALEVQDMDHNSLFTVSPNGAVKIGTTLTALANGNVGIGTTDPGTYKLAVEGKIGAREIMIHTNSWADYVFQKEYGLMPLYELEEFIDNNGHLPEIPKEAEVIEDGINVGLMQEKLLQKIEELTLYIIEQQKEIDELKEKCSDK